MNRTQFIKQCGFACLGAIAVSTLSQSCSGTRQLTTDIIDNKMIVPLSAFFGSGKTDSPQYKRFLVLRNEQLNYPLVVYREKDNQYTALLLRCSHQFNELNVNGELLSCPAHGSEFDAKGNVVNGPAEDKLRSFATTTDNENLYIELA